MALFHIKNFSCHVTYCLKELQHVGYKWVIYGSHPDCSVGQMGQQMQPSFNPGMLWQYRTREIFGGVKYWRIHISLTFGW